MMDRDEWATMAQQVQDLLEAKFGVKSRDLAHGFRRTGRRLPRRMRRQGRLLARAETVVGNPKLWCQVDQTGLIRAFRELTEHLQAIDVAERRKDRLLRLAAVLALNVILVTAAFVWFLWWRGAV